MPSTMTAEEEVRVALEIRKHEKRMLSAFSHMRSYESVCLCLDTPDDRTHGSAVERQRVAIAECGAGDSSNRSLRKHYRKALKGWEAAERARWLLARCCEHIAYAEALKRSSKMDPADLAQDGMEGLYWAAVRFDPDRGLRFSTYAKWWCRMRITRSIDQRGSEIRQPAGVHEKRRNLNKLVRELELGGKDYTDADLAKWLGWSDGEVRRIREIPMDPVGISTGSQDDDGPRQQSVELSTMPPDVLANMESRRLSCWLWWAVSQLRYRERVVVRMVNGLDRRGQAHTYTEVASVLGVSKQRVQIMHSDAVAAISALPRDQDHGCPAVSDQAFLDLRTGHVLDLIWSGASPQEIARTVSAGRRELASMIRRLVSMGWVQIVDGYPEVAGTPSWLQTPDRGAMTGV